MEEPLFLPPGFRFHPTDEEIITCYLMEKAADPSFWSVAIGEASFNESEPWDLPGKAKTGEKEWYFFCLKDRKYPTGIRANRATASGYWKATGKDREIFQGKGDLVGMKKTLVFYRGRAPRGVKTNWVMHEYRLEGNGLFFNVSAFPRDEWVVCKVYRKRKAQPSAAERMGGALANELLVAAPPHQIPDESAGFSSSRNEDMEIAASASAGVTGDSAHLVELSPERSFAIHDLGFDNEWKYGVFF
ncbi:hypothetical protein HPP92_026455 [Vanilla planifolia]|uniref:NAC domain-containing protein n=1 Tax=Vanilla planifolia TaxID=51239 RepID=A0A835PG83_VANPL|nr:hypothetical protein HPP92_026677 [Vanilla planifolia]KAG0450984.1 hypothetical protein HPP92_026455 [Vanilla planifolia]